MSLKERVLQKLLSRLARGAHRRTTHEHSGAVERLDDRTLLAATPVGGVFPLHAPGDDPIADVDVASAPDGKGVAAWVTGAGDVFVRLLGANGSTASNPIRANGASSAEIGPAVAVSHTGAFVVVWIAPDGAVIGRRFDPAGAAQGDEFLVAPAADHVAAVDVAMDADGDFLVAWAVGPEQLNPASIYQYEGSAVFAKRFEADGDPAGTAFRVDLPTNDDIYVVASPKVAMDDDGDAVIGWSRQLANYATKTVCYRYQGYEYCYDVEYVALKSNDILVRRFPAGVNPAQAPAPKVVASSTSLTTGLNLHDVDIDADGDFLVTWQADRFKIIRERYDGYVYEYLRFRGSELRVQRFNAAGDAVKKARRVVKTNAAARIGGASTAIDPDGDFLVAWFLTDPPEDYYLYDVAAAAFSSARSGPAAWAKGPSTVGRVGTAGYFYPEPIVDAVFVREFDKSSKPDGAVAQVATTGMQTVASLAVAQNSTGGAIVGWLTLELEELSSGFDARALTVT